MSEQPDEQIQGWMTELREAMKDPNVSVRIVTTMTHGRAVRVQIGARKIGPLIFPPTGGGLVDVFTMLGGMADG